MESDDRLSTLTIPQEKILSLLGVIPGFLSILGSSTIIYKNIRNYGEAGPYDRLLLALSVCDIVATISFVLAPFLIPAGDFSKSARVYAIGTPGTCSALGWMTQFGFSAIVYNGALSFYYLATVRFKVSRQRFAERYEKWIHCSILLFFFGTATMGAFIGLFNELDLGFGCWANDYPDGCQEEDCTSYLFGYVIAAIPVFLVLVSLIVNNLVIFRYVRRNFQTSRQRTPSNRATSLEEMERELRQSTQLREVATQGFLYVGSFFLTYTPGFLLRIRESQSYTREDEDGLFVLMIFSYFLLPWQGFFNMIIYNRPAYARMRVANPERSRLWAFQYVCFNSDIPKLTTLSLSTASRLRSNHNSTGSNTQRRAVKFSSDLAPVLEEEEEGEIGLSEIFDEGGPSLSLPQSSRNLMSSEEEISTGTQASFQRINMNGSVQ